MPCTTWTVTLLNISSVVLSSSLKSQQKDVNSVFASIFNLIQLIQTYFDQRIKSRPALCPSLHCFLNCNCPFTESEENINVKGAFCRFSSLFLAVQFNWDIYSMFSVSLGQSIWQKKCHIPRATKAASALAVAVHNASCRHSSGKLSLLGQYNTH